MVTLEDIVEELVGEIEDEYDPSARGEHVEIEPGVWSVAASSRPDEIERITGFDLPDGDYDTVAGLVLDRLEHIPSVGEMFVVDGIQIEVVEVDGFAIHRLQLARVDPTRHRRDVTPAPKTTSRAASDDARSVRGHPGQLGRASDSRSCCWH